MYKYFELNSGKVSSWESKELFNEKIASVSVSALPQIDNLPIILYNNDRIKLKLSKISLKQDKVTYKHGPIVNIYIAYELISSAMNIGITLHNFLFGRDFIQGIDVTAIYAEKMYSTNFAVDNGDNSYLFVNEKKIIKFKAKDSEFVPYPLCLGNISTDFDIGHMLN